MCIFYKIKFNLQAVKLLRIRYKSWMTVHRLSMSYIVDKTTIPILIFTFLLELPKYGE